MVGEMEKSATVLDDAVEAARLTRNEHTICWALMSRSNSALLGGDLETALATGAESVAIARSFDRGLISAFAGASYAQALLEAGDSAAALDELLACGGGADLHELKAAWRGRSFEALTRCFLQLGQHGDAETAAAHARDQVETFGTPRVKLMADLADAEIALSDGRPGDAVQFATSAIALAESIGARVYVAQCRTLAGAAFAAAGRTQEGIEHLQRAASDFDSMHATRYRDQVESQLRQLGQTIHRRSRPGAAGISGIATLTGRELEVADLVRRRRTNKQIAEELFLSIKTVETHVRNLFNKLDVTTRADIATVLTRHDGVRV
jgi:DNA-binding NarL/FixJ family response regulator